MSEIPMEAKIKLAEPVSCPSCLRKKTLLLLDGSVEECYRCEGAGVLSTITVEDILDAAKERFFR